MSHLVFNSFPRSGNVFLNNVASKAFSMEMSAAHMPEIFGVPGLCNVSIFRLPSDAIASLVNKTRENSHVTTSEGALDHAKISRTIDRAVITYDKYINGVRANLDKVEVVLFTTLIDDYDSVIQGIANKFSLQINDNYKSMVSLDDSSPIWANKYDGHMPRGKDKIRVDIEDLVSSVDSVKSLNVRYMNFLSDLTD